ncbi:EP-cadherin [Holothuria leucospilota]|uniref:EP-cadherin n=1 Tax=Holothuria leucospilota TaxID=206669 RepID=A0A9Q0YJZ4_HOLLE|nr:EP-cadherin [Holothuria leucospilota]
MAMLWINRCLLSAYLLSFFFAGSFEQQWCGNQGYIPNEQLCLDMGGQYIQPLHCLFELNEEEEIGHIVFNVNLPSCNPSDVVVTFAEDGGSYLEYDETKNAVVVSNRIDVDVLKDGRVWEFIEGSVNCMGAPKSEAFCFTIQLININDNHLEIAVNEEIVYVRELEIQFVSRIIDNLTIVEGDLGSGHSTLYEIAEKDVPFGLIPTKDEDGTTIPPNPGCKKQYGGNELETKYSLIVTAPVEIDYETTHNYTLNIWAWEGDGCSSEKNLSRSDHAVITVHVIDADDLPPEFESNLHTATVREGEVDVLLSVSPEIKAEDGDTLGDEIEYTLADDPNSACREKLEINRTSAVITVIEEFVFTDQKECIVQIKATQVKNLQQSSEVPLIITILPANKACPTFFEESFSGVYFNGHSYVLNMELVTLEMQVTDTDLVGIHHFEFEFVGYLPKNYSAAQFHVSHYFLHLTFIIKVFEGNITVPPESLYDVTDVRTEGQLATFRLSPNEEPITQNTTLKVFVSDDYLGCGNSATVFVHLVISDFIFDDQSDCFIRRVLVSEGDTDVAFDPPTMRIGACSTYDITNEFQGTFTVINEKIRPKIVSDRPFDYERVREYQVTITAVKGELAGGICTATSTNDTAIITITVVDLNDETPVFKVANTSGVLFEAVFFDVMGDEEIFNLANRVYDADATASLAFTLYSPDPPPLLYYQTDGSVLTGSSFDFLRNVDSNFDYTVNVTDTNTDVNNGWSTCLLKFGIMGCNDIFIFEGYFDRTQEGGNNGVMEERPEEIVSMCEEMGNIGWSLHENAFIKIDRILQDGDTYYIWVYGVNPVVPEFLTKTDLNKDEVVELIKINCRFSNVEQSSRTTFDNYRQSGYLAITFSAIIFIGVISMITFLFYSLNSNEEARTAQHEVEQESGNPAADSNHDDDVIDLPAQTETSQNKYDRKIWPNRNFYNSAEAAGANVFHYYEGVYSRNIEKSDIETETHEMETFTHSDGGRSQVIIHNYFEQA